MYKKNIIFIICIAIFILITFPFMITHIPHCDENQNYMVARFLTFGNFAEVLASHGHAILWYLIMMPFAKFHSLHMLYPYPMLVVNYLFLIIALVLMWIKAPFNNAIKFTVTFSYMMVSYFAIVARCYTIGILGLFLLAFLYKQQSKRPILYSVILGTVANTSAMAGISVAGFTILFFYHLFKDRKLIGNFKIILSMVILIITFGFLVYPILKYGFPTMTYNHHQYIDALRTIFYPYDFNLTFVLLFIFIIFMIIAKIFIVNSSDKSFAVQGAFYICSTIIFQFLFMLYVYFGNHYHFYFMFINMIIAIWIQDINSPQELSTEGYVKNPPPTNARHTDHDDLKIRNTYILFFCVSFAMLLYNPNILSYVHGNYKLFNYGKSIRLNKEKYNDSVFIFVNKARFSMYDISPFLTSNNSITVLNGNYNYSWDMLQECNLTLSDIDNIVSKFEKNVYIVAHETLPYELIETLGNVFVYKYK